MTRRVLSRADHDEGYFKELVEEAMTDRRLKADDLTSPTGRPRCAGLPLPA